MIAADGVLIIIILIGFWLLWNKVSDVKDSVDAYLAEDDEFVLQQAYEKGANDGAARTMEAVRDMLLARHGVSMTDEDEAALDL